MDLESIIEFCGIGLVPDPLFSLRVIFSNSIAQCPMGSARVAHLRRELGQQILAVQVATRLRDLMDQHLWKSKMLKQRNDVCEGFVKSQHVIVRGLHEVLMKATNDDV